MRRENYKIYYERKLKNFYLKKEKKLMKKNTIGKVIITLIGGGLALFGLTSIFKKDKEESCEADCNCEDCYEEVDSESESEE